MTLLPGGLFCVTGTLREWQQHEPEAAWEQLSRSSDVGDASLGTAASQDARRCPTHVTIVVIEIDLRVLLHLVFTVDNLRVQFSLSPSPRCRGYARF